MTYMTFVENEGENKQQLSTWVTNDGFVHIEIQPEGNTDYHAYQSLSLESHDVEALIKELQRFLNEYDLRK